MATPEEILKNQQLTAKRLGQTYDQASGQFNAPASPPLAPPVAPTPINTPPVATTPVAPQPIDNTGANSMTRVNQTAVEKA